MKILITKSTKIVQLVLRKLVKIENFDYVINDQTPPPPPPVINRKHLKPPPPSADYVICERPLNRFLRIFRYNIFEKQFKAPRLLNFFDSKIPLKLHSET